MSSKPALSPEILRSQEEAFIQHYRWLIRWALQFSNNDRTRAEDLVQEVFAQFALAHTDLSTVKNIPAYLYTTLRNIHVSEVQMAGRSHVESQSIIDFSIADAALAASDPIGIYQIQDQLRRVCQYACMRKQSSRAASVLILRYFHGYHISEVAAVLGGKSQAVRQCLRFARNEARLFLDDPDALTFINRRQVLKEVPVRTICSAEELLADLRLAIFRSCEGECFGTGLLRAFYEKELILKVDNLALAHMVCCRRCLDGANQELGLPLLIERHPADALGPDTSWRGGPGASGGTGRSCGEVRPRRRGRGTATEIGSTFLLGWQRRARELFEHHPRELCVSANGHWLGSQSVNSDVSRLRLDITICEPLSFIEVLSEENARLLVMNIDAPPDCEVTQTQQMTLSEGRRIEATLRYGHRWPMIEVVYENPSFMAESQLSTSNVDRLRGLNSALSAESTWLGPGEPALVAPSLIDTAPIAPTSERVRYPSQEAIESTGAAAKVSSKSEHLASLFDFWRAHYLIRRPFWSRPGFIAGVLSLFLIGALLFLRLNITPPVSAANLLERASAKEDVITAETDKATHRAINLEDRNHTTGELIARSRIEVWRETAGNLSVRRMYNEKGELTAGEWARSHPTRLDPRIASLRTIYHRGEAPRIEPSGRTPQAAIRDLEIWQLEPSARDYREMIGQADTARVSEGPASYIVSYVGEQVAGDSTLLQATLTLRKSDLHPIEQTLIVKRGRDVHEYRFVEASFERSPIDAVVPGVFAVDRELLSEERKKDDGTIERKGDSLHPSSFIPTPSRVATGELEIEVAYLLDKFRARFGDQINLTRTSEGALRIEGIVDTDATKEEILQVLASVVDNPALTVKISTAAEALQRQQQRPSDSVVVREFTGADKGIPVYPELRQYISREGASQAKENEPGPPSQANRIDQAVRAFAVRMVSRSSRMLSHAIELKQLSERFSPPQLKLLAPDARAKWLTMIHNHSGDLQRETLLLSRELQPILFSRATPRAETEEVQISDDAGLALAIARAYKLALANDEAIL
jgi:RNA polymerase sigma factor (sigma-70 family)